MSKAAKLPTNTRRRHTNSKLGCLNCKRKKIRCDETLPLCNNCSRGKKEACSYLSLSSSETNRIRLAHLLRNSQNRLLSQNYRLPTSSTNTERKRPENGHPSPADAASDAKKQRTGDENDDRPSLEFKFQLADLPLNFPSSVYRPLQYNHLTINDFGNEFRVIVDDDPVSAENSPASDERPTPGEDRQREGRGDSARGENGRAETTRAETTRAEIARAEIARNGAEPAAKSSRNHTAKEPPSAHKNGISLPSLPMGAGFRSPTSFRRIRYRKEARKLGVETGELQTVPLNFCHHVLQGKFNVMNYFHDILLFCRRPAIDMSLLLDAFLFLGRVGALLRLQRTCEYQPGKYLDRFMDMFEKRCFEHHTRVLACLEKGVASFLRNTYSEPPGKLFNYHTSAFMYVTYFVMLSTLMLGCSPESYFKLFRFMSVLYSNYTKHYLANHIEKLRVVSFLNYSLRYNMMSVHIPSYNPTFLYEVNSNLKSLSFAYDSRSVDFQQPELNLYFCKLHAQFNNLRRFLDDHLLPVLFSARDESTVTTYPPTVMFSLMQRFVAIFPSDAMTIRSEGGFQNQVVRLHSHPEESNYLSDLSITLYIYFYALSAGMESVFPACKYAFSSSYSGPINKFFRNPSIITPKFENRFHTMLFPGLNVGHILQRHNFYTLRVHAFLLTRYRFYQTNVIWKHPFSDALKSNRLKSRAIRNLLEVPVRSFNTTLIRPEHYPTQIHGHYDLLLRDPTIALICTRSDKTMDNQLYTHNIETLDFFSERTELEFVYESGLLSRDYRPMETELSTKAEPLDIRVIEEYYADRIIIMEGGG